MLLTVAEQILMKQSIPLSGSINFMKLMRSIRGKFKIDDAEIQRRVTKDGSINESLLHELTTYGEEIDFTDDEVQAVKQLLFEMSKQGKITEDHLDLCEKFGVE